MILARTSRIGRMVWQAYAFLAPGGKPYDPKQNIPSQAHQGFGAHTALQYIVQRARSSDARATVDLDQVFNDATLNASAWVKSAKTRVTETLFMERLLTTVRELISVSS